MTRATTPAAHSRANLHRSARKHRHATEARAVAAYNRDGVSAACEALGAGNADDWGELQGGEE